MAQVRTVNSPMLARDQYHDDRMLQWSLSEAVVTQVGQSCADNHQGPPRESVRSLSLAEMALVAIAQGWCVCLYLFCEVLEELIARVCPVSRRDYFASENDPAHEFLSRDGRRMLMHGADHMCHTPTHSIRYFAVKFMLPAYPPSNIA